MADQRPAILITGVSGGLASILTRMLTDEYRLIGVDPRPIPEGRNFPGEFFQLDYTHRKMEEVFRQNRFHAFLHLGRVRTSALVHDDTRYRLNVLGTRNLLNLARKYQIRNIIIFSTFHVYGAHQHNHYHLSEDDPLRASQVYPALADAIELDHAATTFLWRYQDTRVLVLRPVNVVGPRIQNTITKLLRSPFCPTLLGYDPLMQFVHERDIAKALRLCLNSAERGIFNIAGEGAIPWSKAIRLAGSTPFPFPSRLAYPLVNFLSRAKLSFPRYLIDYFKYPTVVSDDHFREVFGYKPDVNMVEALKSLRRQPL